MIAQRKAVTARFRALVVATLICGFIASVSSAPSSAATSTATSRYIVVFKSGTDLTAEVATARANGLTIVHQYRKALQGFVADLSPAQLSRISSNPRVDFVEPDSVMTTSATQPDATWGLDRIDQRALPLSTTYEYSSQGAGVTAYVIDTGVRSDMADMNGRVSAGFTAVNDGNGTSDCNGHGTHVAGTIASTTYGVAKAVSVVPVRVLDCAGSGYVSDIVRGIDWVIANAAKPAVANMSLGGGASSSLDAAVSSLISNGITTVVAAGNSKTDACRVSPARVGPAITVGATTSSDARASFSNFGTCVDIFAPGVSVTSLWPTSTTATNTISGTSMASPHVAGAAALLLASNSSWTPSEVASALVSNATIGVVTGAGTGSPNRLLFTGTSTGPTTPATRPMPPTNVHATAGTKGRAAITWVQGSNGGSALTSQTIFVYSAGTKIGSAVVSGTATSAIIGGLKAGVIYSFTVAATNAIGMSDESVASNFITASRL